MNFNKLTERAEKTLDKYGVSLIVYCFQAYDIEYFGSFWVFARATFFCILNFVTEWLLVFGKCWPQWIAKLQKKN